MGRDMRALSLKLNAGSGNLFTAEFAARLPGDH